MAKRTKTGLNPKQEKFCQLYASDKEFFGNGVDSYMAAYNLPASKYSVARSSASNLLTNPNILARIDELLDIMVNNEVVDKELGFVIIQKDDLPSKVSAIKEYNRVRKRVDEAPKVLMIGQLLQSVEKQNVAQTIGQELPPPDLLLDQEQATGTSAVSKKQSAKRV